MSNIFINPHVLDSLIKLKKSFDHSLANLAKGLEESKRKRIAERPQTRTGAAVMWDTPDDFVNDLRGNPNHPAKLNGLIAELEELHTGCYRESDAAPDSDQWPAKQEIRQICQHDPTLGTQIDTPETILCPTMQIVQRWKDNT